MDTPSFPTIISSVSTRQRPSRRARIRPTEDFPAPMKPTRITLSAMTGEILALSAAARLLTRGPGKATRSSPVHRERSRRAAIGAVAHPAATALGEVVVHAGFGAEPHQEGDALGRGHEAGVVERHCDRPARAEPEERRLLGGVPPRVAGTDAVGDPESVGQRRLAEQVIGVLGQALDGGGADAVQHHGQRKLASLEQRAHARLDGIADGADPGAYRRALSPQPTDLGDMEPLASRLD